MESFYQTLKRKFINDAHYTHREQAQQEIFKYIEIYYNTKRMHSALNFQTPLQFEKDFISTNQPNFVPSLSYHFHI